MLMKSGINPFDSQEAKPYKNDGEILAMTNLVTAYQNNDINEFEKILKVFFSFFYSCSESLNFLLQQNRQTIMEDTFIREHIEDLLRNIRTQVNILRRTMFLFHNCLRQVLIKLIKPYTRINIKFISGELNIDPTDVESLLVSCILDSTINGRIDQVSSRSLQSQVTLCVLSGDRGVGAGQAQRGHRPLHRSGQVEHPAQQPPEACHQQNGIIQLTV